jgi:hypothetical protein
MEKYVNNWNKIHQNCLEDIQSILKIISRIKIITPKNCGVLNKFPNFSELLKEKHMEVAKKILTSLKEKLYVSNLFIIFLK